eukprot:11154195-Ditylum_brightwellii.AAC.1
MDFKMVDGISLGPRSFPLVACWMTCLDCRLENQCTALSGVVMDHVLSSASCCIGCKGEPTYVDFALTKACPS